MSKFLESLANGHLAFATNLAAQKIHIVTLDHTAAETDIECLSKHLTKKARAKQIAEIKPDRYHMWSAVALCGVRGETANYGNYNSYYWHPEPGGSMDNVCKKCFKDWKKQGEPEIQGHDRSGHINEDWPWELPFGWHEVPVIGHPWETADKSKINSIKDGTGDVVGRHAAEVKRFRRGQRLVRLVHDLSDDTYYARYWDEGADPSEDRYTFCGALQYAREGCQKLMAQGGY